MSEREETGMRIKIKKKRIKTLSIFKISRSIVVLNLYIYIIYHSICMHTARHRVCERFRSDQADTFIAAEFESLREVCLARPLRILIHEFHDAYTVSGK